MSAYDLTTVANVKAWLGLPATPTPSDTTLSALVVAASRAIHAVLSRGPLIPHSCTDTIDLESERVYLNYWPVLAVEDVLLDGLVMPQASTVGGPPSLGYLLQPSDGAPPGRPQAQDLFGRRCHTRRQSLIVSYQAGYAVQNETAVAPSGAPYQIVALAPFGPWASDLGVAYAGGPALTAVATAPAVGQYGVSAGVYRFNAGDAGAALSISYGFTPQDLVQAATELAAERFRAAERIGLRSKSLGGQETIAYDLSAMSAAVQALIGPYRRTGF